jgi:hypothetical protein
MLSRSSPLENQTLYAAMLVFSGFGSETVSLLAQWLIVTCLC